MNKILTLDDLVKFCAEQKIKKFDSKEAGRKIRVQVPAKFEMDEEESSSTLFAHIQIMHTGRNRNGSNLTEKAAKECLSTIPYKPLLANFCEIDGVRDFTSHDYFINDDGEVEYLERQIGCFTADKAYMEDDEKVEGRKNIFAKVAIPREYTDAAEIIERKNGTKVSAELEINSMSYDSKEKELLLESVELIGCTCLGVNPETGEEVQEGMENSHIQLEDFSVDNNFKGIVLNEEIKKFIQASVEETLNNKSCGKEGNAQMEFEENANVTETSEEAVTTEFVEAEQSEETFEEETATEESTEESTVTEAESTDDIEDTPSEDEDNSEANFDDEVIEDEEVKNESDDEDESEEVVTEEPDAELNSLKMSVNINGERRDFEVSLLDKLSALYELVNSTYSESDNDYYDVDVYEESKIVVMHGWFTGKHFRQQFAVKKDVYSLKGDRVEVFAQYLTTDEINQLDSMKQTYAEVSEKLAKYESEPDKIAVLESKDYANLEGNEAFEALKTQDAHFDLSVEELKSKCDSMLLEYAKGHKVEFEAKLEEEVANNKTVGFKHIIPESPSKKAGKYGGIFSRNKK